MNTERILKVLALAVHANPNLPIPLTLDNIDLIDVHATPKEKRNTAATMSALDTGEIVRYVGSSGVVYDRINIATYWPTSPIIEAPTANIVGDLVVILKARYGLDVYNTEILNANDVLPDKGDVEIIIDDAASPLYIGKAVVGFTKDAGLDYSDGIAYEMQSTVNNPILAYHDTGDDLIEVSINGGIWSKALVVRQDDGMFTVKSATPVLPGLINVRVRGAKVVLSDVEGNYVPIKKLIQYKSLHYAEGFFTGNTSLLEISADAFNSRPELNNADFLFDGCTLLTTIPNKLFSRCLHLKSVVCCFRRTAIMAIPEDLLESCAQLTDATSLFEQCVNVRVIPPKLFETNTALVTLERCFIGCTGVTGDIPSTLLQNQINLQNVNWMFAGNPWVEFIPPYLFANSVLLTTMVGTFSRCTGLSTIPSSLLSDLVYLNNTSRLFEGCTGIRAIPTTLLDGLLKLEYAEGMFQYSGITVTPTLLFDNCRRLLSIDYIFAGCIGITTIPATILNPLLRLNQANGIWKDCSGITVIPNYLLIKNTNVLSIDWLFSGTSITVIPPAVFQYTTKVKSAVGVFAKTKVLSVPQATFSFMLGLEVLDMAFYKVSTVTTVASMLLNWNAKLKSVYGIFAYCQSLTGSIINPLSGGGTRTVTNVSGMYQGCGLVNGSLAALKTSLPTVDWTNPDSVAGVVAGATRLTDYSTIGTVYKTPVPGLV